MAEQTETVEQEKDLEVLLKTEDRFPPPEEFAEQANANDPSIYDEGEVREERLLLGSASASSKAYSAGELFDFSPADIHRVVHHGAAPAVTLHVYSPRIARPGAYSIGSDGALRRHQVSSGEELRPLEAVGP